MSTKIIDRELEYALQRRAMLVENRLNIIRLITGFVLVVMDFVIFIKMGQMNNGLFISLVSILVIILVLGLYIQKKTTSTKYYPTLKYISATFDFTALFARMYFFLDLGLTTSFATNADVALVFITIIIYIILIEVSSLRFGLGIIIYTTFLGTVYGIILLVIIESIEIYIIYAALFLIISGLVSMWISRSSNRLFTNLLKRERLTRFLSREIVESIDTGKLKMELGGEKRFATVLFADIRNFTEISENTDPNDLVTMLNYYFSEMTKVIFKNKGTIDKFIGDAIMAIFGVPVSDYNDEYRAVQTAIQMQERLTSLNKILAEKNYKPLSIGIALHSGIVVAGNVGSSERMDYTVIGDTVNVTSRIEGLNKNYNTSILISDVINEKIKDRIKTKFVDETQLRGRSEQIKLYTVIGDR